jgi:pimeloyl-ACP methyl ester carboxylesterase
MPTITSNNLSLYYRDDGSGGPVLFIQGLGLDHRGWASITKPLSDRFRCISYDNRDIGRSSFLETPYDVVDMMDDAIGLLDALEIERCDVVGASMGGVIAQELAIRHPERVRRLVLVSTYTSSDPRGAAIFESQAMLRRILPREDYCRATFWSVYSHQDYRREGFIDEMVRRAAGNELWQPQDAYERHVRAVLNVNTEDRLKDIKAKTLIITGAEDILTPPRFSTLLAERIPDNRLLVVEGAGHGLIWSHPAIVVDHAADFLSAT